MTFSDCTQPQYFTRQSALGHIQCSLSQLHTVSSEHSVSEINLSLRIACHCRSTSWFYILISTSNNLTVLKETLDEATDPWGVRVQMVELKDVMLPVQLQRAMAAEAEAAREARAKVIAAEGERDASQSLQEAARVIQKSPQALQVRAD